MTDSLLADAAETLFARSCKPGDVRAWRTGAAPAAFWAEVEAAGFLDALMPEAAQGAGLALRDLLPLAIACGRRAVPLPICETIVVRGALYAFDASYAPGPIAIAVAHTTAEGYLFAEVPNGRYAESVLLARLDTCCLLARDRAVESQIQDLDPSSPRLTWQAAEAQRQAMPADCDWLALGALLTLGRMAGAMERVFEMTLRHAQERSQFGRALGKFQAIQQQISVMTEHVQGSRIAAELAFGETSASAIAVDRDRIAVAKIFIGEAAVAVTAIAHAVHGAIGIADEFDLHLYTQVLHSGRLAFGSDVYWASWLGKAALAAPQADVYSFIRENL